MMQLLPPNATDFELKVVDSALQNTAFNADIGSLARITDAPSHFLPVLAWQFSVDRWQDDWSDDVKRTQIQNAINIHRFKGTNYSLQQVAASFGYRLVVTEWFNENPMNEPGTFQVTIDTNGRELTEKNYNTLVDLLHDAKPLTRELKAIEVNSVAVRGDTNLACGMYDGEEVTIYPKLESFTPSVSARFAHYGDDNTLIWPQLTPSIPQLSFRFAHYGQDDTTIYSKPS